MATGIQSSDSKLTYTVRLVEGALAANGVPTAVPIATPTAGVGFLMPALAAGYALAPECSIWIYTTAGSATMGIAPSRLWGFHWTSATAGLWFPMGTGTAATAGYLNEGVAYDETGTDQISRVEVVYLPSHCDGIYVQLGVITGTATAVNVDAKFNRHAVK
jgi:hypothetical protein